MLQTVKKVVAASASLLILAACTANGSITPIPNDPNDPDPTPTATPTATPTTEPTASPTPQPTATPGWSSVVIQANINTYAEVLAEIRRLQANGQVTGVSELQNYQIRINASASIIAMLTEIASAEIVPFSTLLQRELNSDGVYTSLLATFDEFVSFWRQNVNQLDAVPGIDFNTHSVIAIYPGKQTRLGYTTSVVSIKKTNKQLKVRYKVTAPAQNTVAAAFNPVHIVLVPQSRMRGDFETVVYEQIQ